MEWDGLDGSRQVLVEHALRMRSRLTEMKGVECLNRRVAQREVRGEGHVEEEEEVQQEEERRASLIAQLETAIEVLESCVSMVDVSNEQGNFKVLGFTADDSLVQYMLSSAASFYIVIFSLAIPGMSALFTTAGSL